MNRYLYKNAEECKRALILIKEQIIYQGKDETVNALEIAIKLLDILIIQDNKEEGDF